MNSVKHRFNSWQLVLLTSLLTGFLLTVAELPFDPDNSSFYLLLLAWAGSFKSVKIGIFILVIIGIHPMSRKKNRWMYYLAVLGINGLIELATILAFPLLGSSYSFLLYFVLLQAILLLIFQLNYTIHRTKEVLQALNRSRLEEVEVKLLQLKQQLNPHFLFNALNVLKSLITIDPQKAINYTIDLADLLRITVNDDKKEVNLSEELELCALYLNIQNMRFNENILLENAIPFDWMEKKIPFLTLLLLLENAIKHNAVSRSNKLFIQLYIDDGMLVVQNNVNKKESADKESGIGLKNIEKRFQLLYGKKVGIENEDSYFRVKLPLEA